MNCSALPRCGRQAGHRQAWWQECGNECVVACMVVVCGGGSRPCKTKMQKCVSQSCKGQSRQKGVSCVCA